MFRKWLKRDQTVNVVVCSLVGCLRNLLDFNRLPVWCVRVLYW